MQNTDILRVDEVAELLKVSERTVYDWAQKGSIPCGKLGSTWRFKRKEIERWVDSKLVKSERKSAEVMQIKSVLSEDNVLFVSSETKEDLLNLLIDQISIGASTVDKKEISEGIFHREANEHRNRSWYCSSARQIIFFKSYIDGCCLT